MILISIQNPNCYYAGTYEGRKRKNRSLFNYPNIPKFPSDQQPLTEEWFVDKYQQVEEPYRAMCDLSYQILTKILRMLVFYHLTTFKDNQYQNKYWKAYDYPTIGLAINFGIGIVGEQIWG